jgi:hypothetical protein
MLLDTADIECIASNCRIIDEEWIVKDFEGSSHKLIEALSRHLFGVTEEIHEEPQSGSPESRSRFEPLFAKM